MSEIQSASEEKARERVERVAQAAREMAAAYYRVFSSDDGKRVLADLRAKFGLRRLVFKLNASGRYDYLDAAIRDGERHVMAEIENALIATGFSPI